jgi:hypothetical protein
MADHSLCCGASMVYRQHLVRRMAERYGRQREKLGFVLEACEEATQAILTSQASVHLEEFQRLAAANTWVAQRVDKLLSGDGLKVSSPVQEALDGGQNTALTALRWRACAYHADRIKRTRHFIDEMDKCDRWRFVRTETEEHMGSDGVWRRRKSKRLRVKNLLREEAKKVACRITDLHSKKAPRARCGGSSLRRKVMWDGTVSESAKRAAWQPPPPPKHSSQTAK